MILSNLTNLKRCFDSYVYTNLQNTEGLNIDFQGLPFDTVEVDSWIQPRIITAYDNREYRDNEVKQSATVLLQVNIFAKKSSVTSSDEHYRLRDIVDNYFKIGQDITYSVSGSTLATARVRDLQNDFAIEKKGELGVKNKPIDVDYFQYVLSYEIDYTEL